MENIIEIIATAKTKESWSVSGKYNYGPIDYFHDKVLYADHNLQENFARFEQHVHEVTDAHTYMVWLFKDYDIYVDCTQIVCSMQRAFPNVSFEQVMAWIEDVYEPHHVLNLDTRIAPEKYQGMYIYQIFNEMRKG
ncbi:MAG: hypothetical protein IKQ32_06015 [Prevotella sp.]|nr:hypothetical protein [Prevotella sp.]